MDERVEWKPARFRAETSTADTCVCNACHNVGNVVKLTIPETKYFDRKNLTTRYSEFWLCMNCRESLIQSLTKEG